MWTRPAPIHPRCPRHLAPILTSRNRLTCQLSRSVVSQFFTGFSVRRHAHHIAATHKSDFYISPAFMQLYRHPVGKTAPSASQHLSHSYPLPPHPPPHLPLPSLLLNVRHPQNGLFVSQCMAHLLAVLATVQRTLSQHHLWLVMVRDFIPGPIHCALLEKFIVRPVCSYSRCNCGFHLTFACKSTARTFKLTVNGLRCPSSSIDIFQVVGCKQPFFSISEKFL